MPSLRQTNVAGVGVAGAGGGPGPGPGARPVPGHQVRPPRQARRGAQVSREKIFECIYTDIRAILDIVVFISIFRVFNMSGQAGTNLTLSCPANTKVTSKYLDKLNHYTSQCPPFAKISIMQKK